MRCIVVTGAGRALCARADLSAGATTFAKSREGNAGPVEPLYPWHLRKPVIAAVNGHAVGVAMTFAMACDVRYVARAIGFSRAAVLMLSGWVLRGSEAVEWGLASRSLPADQVLPQALFGSRSGQ